MAISHIKYITQAVQEGKTKEEMYMKLLSDGLKITEIEEAFLKANADRDNKEEAQKKTIYVVATIGAILIGLGIFSFIAANWQEMSRMNKMAVVLFAMLCVDGIGWYLREKIHLMRSGEAMLLLGSLIFGGAVFLAAQMYNTSIYWPDGFLWWALGSLAVAFVLDIMPVYWLAVIAGFIGLIWYPFGLFGGSIYHPLFLTQWLLLLVVSGVFLFIGIKTRKSFLIESPDKF
jgi:uncharacterized membrane protein